MTTDKLKALLAKATRGPWKWVRDHSGLGGPWRLAPGVMWPSNSEATPDGDEIDRANASLIALAPTLAVENIALREQKERLVEALRGIKADCLERAAFSRDGQTVPIGDGAWRGLCNVLAEIEKEAGDAP